MAEYFTFENDNVSSNPYDGDNDVKGSIDFLAYDSGADCCVGAEIKGRVVSRTDQQALNQVATIRRLLGQDRTPRQRQRKYFGISVDNPLFPRFLDNTHKAVQVVHHAHTYNLDTILLLVGNNAGEVIYGLFVSVPESIRAAYGRVCDDIYFNTLQWAYESDVVLPSKSILEAILKAIVINNAPVDFSSFEMELALWKDIKTMPKPIPRLDRIIPLVFALWNGLKGGSDATTNLIWMCQYDIPTKENQSNAVARILSLSAVHVHRMHQPAVHCQR